MDPQVKPGIAFDVDDVARDPRPGGVMTESRPKESAFTTVGLGNGTWLGWPGGPTDGW